MRQSKKFDGKNGDEVKNSLPEARLSPKLEAETKTSFLSADSVRYALEKNAEWNLLQSPGMASN